MPTQHKGYFLRDGTQVPSVTTIISRFKDAGGLIHWAWNLGREGLDYRKERDKAANAGTLAHAAVEAWTRGQPYTWQGVPEVVQKAQVAFTAFEQWARQTRLKVTHTELPLVSEQFCY